MRRAVALLVAVPACTRLLTVAAHLEQPVGDRQLAVVRVGGGAALAAGMAEVETSEVADGERPHRVADIDHPLVDPLMQAALLPHEVPLHIEGRAYAVDADTVADDAEAAQPIDPLPPPP